MCSFGKKKENISFTSEEFTVGPENIAISVWFVGSIRQSDRVHRMIMECVFKEIRKSR